MHNDFAGHPSSNTSTERKESIKTGLHCVDIDNEKQTHHRHDAGHDHRDSNATGSNRLDYGAHVASVSKSSRRSKRGKQSSVMH